MTAAAAGVNQNDLRAAMSRLVTGVVVATAKTPSGPVGMTINSFTSITLEPATVLICLNTRNRGYEAARSPVPTPSTSSPDRIAGSRRCLRRPGCRRRTDFGRWRSICGAPALRSSPAPRRGWIAGSSMCSTWAPTGCSSAKLSRPPKTNWTRCPWRTTSAPCIRSTSPVPDSSQIQEPQKSPKIKEQPTRAPEEVSEVDGPTIESLLLIAETALDSRNFRPLGDTLDHICNYIRATLGCADVRIRILDQQSKLVQGGQAGPPWQVLDDIQGLGDETLSFSIRGRRNPSVEVFTTGRPRFVLVSEFETESGRLPTPEQRRHEVDVLLADLPQRRGRWGAELLLDGRARAKRRRRRHWSRSCADWPR